MNSPATLETLSLFRIISSAPGKDMVQFQDGLLIGNMFDELELSFETTVQGLARMSFQMERAALEREATGGVIFVGFQKLSRFTPSVAGRYIHMAHEGNRVVVFGLPDAESLPRHPNLRYIELKEADALTQEWFVVIDTPQYWGALSALDLVGFDDAEDVNERIFTGVKTTAPSITREIVAALIRVLDTADMSDYSDGSI